MTDFSQKTAGGKPLFEQGDEIAGLVDVRKRPVVVQARLMDEPFVCRTLEGDMAGNAGDYLVVGVLGEVYPCKPDVFAANFDETW